MNSLEKMLSILDLFGDGPDEAEIRPADVEQATGASRSSAYRYLQALTEAGLITQVSGGAYSLGARILELDRLQRNSDRLLAAARDVMAETGARLGINMILARYYGSRVICSHTTWPDTSLTPIYERGRPLPLFYGAIAKVILANLSAYQKRNLMLRHLDEIRKAGLGADWKEFRSNMTRLRNQVSCVTHSEITPESIGVGAPLFDPDHRVVGSLAFAVPLDGYQRLGEAFLRREIVAAAEQITTNLAEITSSDEMLPGTDENNR